MDTDKLLDQIKKLCAERDITMNTAFIESGVGKNFKSNFPSVSKKNLNLLARYFNVSVEYLVGAEDEEYYARKVMGLVIEWLTDNGYECETNDIGEVSIEKNGKAVHFSNADFVNESLRIKKVSEDGFELAMESWEREHFPDVVHIRSHNHLFNAINESPNATLTISGDSSFSKQELEIIEVFRELSLETQYKLLTYAFKLREEA